MPNGEGWFIDLRNGEHIPIHEHRQAVLDDPARYRVTAAKVTGKNRSEVLGLVLSRGFVRVRADKSWLVAEFNAPEDEALPHIRQFLRDKGFVGYRRLRLRDHRWRGPGHRRDGRRWSRRRRRLSISLSFCSPSTARFTSNTNSDVSLLNHGNIVGTVTDRQSHDIKTVLDHVDNSSLLTGTNTTAKH